MTSSPPDAIAMSKPAMLLWARIVVMKAKADSTRAAQCWPGQCWSGPGPEAEQEFRISLGKSPNRKAVAFTKLGSASARTLDDAMRDFIEKEKLVEAVLRCVDLCQNAHMSCESLGVILEMLMGYRIQALNLSWNPQLGDSIVAAIQPVLEKKSHVIDLKLAKCGLTVAGLKRLVKVASDSRLRLLDISYTMICDESELIEQVLELPMIEEVAFRFCDLSPEDVRTVSESLPSTGVKALHLAGNTFGSKGLAHLASTLSESMVEELDLSGCGIEAKCESLVQLAEAWAKRPFPTLILRNNPMGHSEIMNFIQMLQTLMPSDSEDPTCMGNVDRRCC